MQKKVKKMRKWMASFLIVALIAGNTGLSTVAVGADDIVTDAAVDPGTDAGAITATEDTEPGGVQDLVGSAEDVAEQPANVEQPAEQADSPEVTGDAVANTEEVVEEATTTGTQEESAPAQEAPAASDGQAAANSVSQADEQVSAPAPAASQVESVKSEAPKAEAPKTEAAAAPENEAVKTEEPASQAESAEEAPEQKLNFPAAEQNFTASAAGYDISVKVPANSFEESVTLKASAQTWEQLTGDVRGQLEKEGVDKEHSQSIDLRFENAAGKEIEPANAVDVKFTIHDDKALEGAADKESKLDVYHAEEKEDGSTQVKQVATKNDNSVKVQSEKQAVAEFKTESFSVFTITWEYTRYNNRTNLEVTCVDENGKELANVDVPANITLNNGVSQPLNSSNKVIEISGYTFKEALATVNGDKYDNVSAIRANYNSNRRVWEYTLTTGNRTVTFQNSVDLKLIYADQHIKITFDKNGGSIDAPPAETGKKGTSIVLPDYDGEKDNHQFLGWTDTKNLEGDSSYHPIHTAGSTYTIPAKDTTLYAAWSKDSGGISKSDFFIRLDGKIPTEPSYYASSLYTTGIHVGENVIKRHWIVDTTHSSIEKSNAQNNVTANLKKLPSPDDLKGHINDNSSTLGFNTKVENNVVVVDKITDATQNAKNYGVKQDDPLYVLWYVQKLQTTGETSELTWHIDGVLLVQSKITLNYVKNTDDVVEDMPLGYQVSTPTNITIGGNGSPNGTVLTPVRTGWTFEGWNTKPDGSGTKYATRDTYRLESDTTLYAQWSRDVINITGTKTWIDGEKTHISQDEVTLKLTRTSASVTSPETISPEGNIKLIWSGDQYTYTNLPAYDDGGNPFTYIVKEDPVPAGYEVSYIGHDITNTITGTTTVSGTKIWRDENNNDGVRPTSITVKLYADGDLYTSKKVNAGVNEEWNYSFTELPKYKNGELIHYSVAEDPIEGYSSEINGYDIINTRTVDKTSFTVVKKWEDNNDQDGIRPEKVTVRLVENGKATDKTIELNKGNNWTASFTNLYMNKDGNPIHYTVEEVGVAGYDSTITGDAKENFEITNTHNPETVTVEGTKIWNDKNNQDGKRPQSITVRLRANGEVVDSQTVEASNNWVYRFEDFPKNEHGQAITYSVTEDEVKDYSTDYNGYNIINSYTPAQKSITVTKEWNDGDNQDNIRPNEVTVRLYANGQDTKKTVKLTAGKNWTDTFTELDVMQKGSVVEYSVREEAVNGYNSYVKGTEESGFTIVNTHKLETVTVEGTKTWDDKNDQDGKRPKSITVKLRANGEVVQEKAVTADDKWAYRFENRPKNEHGQAITYSVTEDEVKDYSTDYNGYNIINSYTPAQKSITVTKEWNDSDNQDGIRPNEVIVHLYADDSDTGKTIRLNEGNHWEDTFTNLDENKGGKAIVYTVKEEKVNGYTSSVKGTAKEGFTIVNTHNPELMTVEGTKTWDDQNNQDNHRPESITIRLHANGKEVDSQQVKAGEDGKWTYKFTNLPRRANGEDIDYSVTEDQVEGYKTDINNYDITNSRTPNKTSVTVTKSWDDSNNQDGIRPNAVTVKLLANKKATGKEAKLDAGNNWTYVFSDLDENEAGQKVVYSVEEEGVSDYTSEVTGNPEEGFIITNTHVTEKTEVSGTKTWDDGNNQDKYRHDSITIRLYANGKEVESQLVTAGKDGKWTYKFTNLPKKADGKDISYSVTEDQVGDYSTEINGYDIKNSRTPNKTSVTVTKSWNDSNNQDGIRPNAVTVKLLANEKATGKEAKLDAGNNWTYVFSDLDENEAGQKIVYSVEEEEVSDYTSEVTGNPEKGFTITNTHMTETTEVSGTKTWDDGNNQDGHRPESITIRLHANGKEVGSQQVKADNNGKWTYKFTNLPKKADGKDISYSVTEDQVGDYSTEINGYDIKNSRTPNKTSVTVTKSWNDSNNQDGIRPNAVTVKLLANEKATGKEVRLDAGNNWTYVFSNLDENEAGQKVVYSVEEEEVSDYTSEVTGNPEKGFTITNTHVTETTEVSGTKTWEDNDNQDNKRPDSITIRLHANGKEVESQQVKADKDGKWEYSFTNLAKKADGKDIVYSVTEDHVEEYSSITKDDRHFINRRTPNKTSLMVTKEWEDTDNQDGIRPKSVKVMLLADGKPTDKTVALSEDNYWTQEFTDLDENKNGKPIVYSVEEEKVKGYSAEVIGNTDKGFTIVNTHVSETTEVKGTKKWEGGSINQRPESITIRLHANGEEKDQVTVKPDNEGNWTYSFTNLPKNENGKEIVYTVTEDQVEDYTAIIDGYNITNQYTPGRTDVMVEKVWNDSWKDREDYDGIRPESVTIKLLADGKDTGKTLKLNKDNRWAGEFVNLDVKKDGKDIVYTVEEVKVGGYTTDITGNAKIGYTITNTHVVVPTQDNSGGDNPGGGSDPTPNVPPAPGGSDDPKVEPDNPTSTPDPTDTKDDDPNKDDKDNTPSEPTVTPSDDKSDKEKHTITYNDGVDGEEIFKDQVYEAETGEKTPAFKGTPTRPGYIFKGWTPEVADTVTGDVTYRAVWEKVQDTPSGNGNTTNANGGYSGRSDSTGGRSPVTSYVYNGSSGGSTSGNSFTTRLSDAVKTGDSTEFLLYLAAMLGAAAVLAGLIWSGKMLENQKKKK